MYQSRHNQIDYLFGHNQFAIQLNQDTTSSLSNSTRTQPVRYPTQPGHNPHGHTWTQA